MQTEQRRRAEAARKAAEAAAEAKQEADIAAYHARLREQEADKQHQHSLGRDNQPAGKQHQHSLGWDNQPAGRLGITITICYTIQHMC